MIELRDRAQKALAKGVGIRVSHADLGTLIGAIDVALETLNGTEPPAQAPDDDPWWYGPHAWCYQDEEGYLRPGKRSTYYRAHVASLELGGTGAYLDPVHPGPSQPISRQQAWALNPNFVYDAEQDGLTRWHYTVNVQHGGFDPELHPTQQPLRHTGLKPDGWDSTP